MIDVSIALSGRVWDEFEDVVRRFEDAWQGRARPEISAYLPTGKGPVFMNMIEKAAGGKDQTTRTWDTLAKVAR